MHTSHTQKQVSSASIIFKYLSCVPGQIKLLNTVMYIFKALYIYRFRYLSRNILINQDKPNQTIEHSYAHIYRFTNLDIYTLTLIYRDKPNYWTVVMYTFTNLDIYTPTYWYMRTNQIKLLNTSYVHIYRFRFYRFAFLHHWWMTTNTCARDCAAIWSVNTAVIVKWSGILAVLPVEPWCVFGWNFCPLRGLDRNQRREHLPSWHSCSCSPFLSSQVLLWSSWGLCSKRFWIWVHPRSPHLDKRPNQIQIGKISGCVV